MTKSEKTDTSRRHFLTTVAPACALACMTMRCATAQEVSAGGAAAADLHPFDTEWPHTLSYRQFYQNRYGEVLGLFGALEKEMGRDGAIDFLKKYTTRRWIERGREQASQTADNSLRQYTEQFRRIENYRNRLSMEIVEDSDEAFELKVTECIWAVTFRNADASDVGFAMICHGDYAWAEGFNPRIELVRDKTLMQGDSLCNHRYVWRG